MASSSSWKSMSLLLLLLLLLMAWAAEAEDPTKDGHDFPQYNSTTSTITTISTLSTTTVVEPRILTVRLRSVTKDVNYDSVDGHIVALEGRDIRLFVYGAGLRGGGASRVKLTTHRAERGGACYGDENSAQSKSFTLDQVSPDGTRALLTVTGEDAKILKNQERVFFCLSSAGVGPSAFVPGSRQSEESFVHQGTNTNAEVEVKERLLPLWLMIFFIALLLCMSGLFSGLNLGLMALDQTELKIVQNTGTKSERSFANKIAPIRSHGNFLLCSLLLGNVLVNSSLTILIDALSTGLIAIVGSTLGIVIFGEIIPQAICSRHGLAVGAYTIWLTKFFMLLTFPLSYPISLLLDKVLGAEIGTVYDKKKLIELLRVTNETNDLEKEEVDIVTGALVYKDKTVKDIMTKIEDVYMLPVDTVLDFDTVSEIREQGYSRIPVFHVERNNIVHVLFAKDLMFVDPDDKMPLTTVCQFYRNNVNFVYHDTPLNVMFNEFKSGDKGHMAFVQDINSEGGGDPFYETVGLVTIEDIIEEIIQQEIVDETDIVADNRTKRKLKREGRKGKGVDFTLLTPQDDRLRRVAISPQLALAVFQYLTTAVEPFKAPVMHEIVLKKLLSLDVFREIKVKKGRTKMEEDLVIIEKGKKMDIFILIIEGRVEVSIGLEGLIFESGPFSFFGIQVLNDVMVESPFYAPYVPPALAFHHPGHGHHGGKKDQLVKAQTSPSLMKLKQEQGNNNNGPTPAVGGGGAKSTSAAASPASLGLAAKRATLPLKRAKTQNALEGVQAFRGFTSTTEASNTNNTHSSPMTASTSKPPQPRRGPFIPDYTVRAATDVLYLQVKKSTYSAAVKASQMRKLVSADQRDIDQLLEKANDEGDEDLVPIMLWQQQHQAGAASTTTTSSYSDSGGNDAARRDSLPRAATSKEEPDNKDEEETAANQETEEKQPRPSSQEDEKSQLLPAGS